MNKAQSTSIAAILMAAFLVTACGGPEPAPERDAAADEAARVAKEAEDLRRKRDDEAAALSTRAADVERRWTEMESTAGKAAGATAALRAEVKEDIGAMREAIDNLKTTTPENWWERHEGALERTAGDIEEDVRRFGRKMTAAKPTKSAPSPAGAPFESRRDQFVDALRSRIDGMEKQLEDVRVRGAQETELKDTRARIDKLQDDLDNLRKADADDWWDLSVARVREYIDRVEASVRRLDDNRKDAR